MLDLLISANHFMIRREYNHPMSQRLTPLVIGIAGGSGSGKTTVAQTILQRVGPDRISFLQHDAYYKDLSGLPPAQRIEVNFDHPNSLENDLLIGHIQQLKNGQPAKVPVYDFSTHSRTDRTFTVPAAQCHPGGRNFDYLRKRTARIV